VGNVIVNVQTLNTILAIAALAFTLASRAALPPDYKGKPFQDSAYK
jgi:hypothetical protein